MFVSISDIKTCLLRISFSYIVYSQICKCILKNVVFIELYGGQKSNSLFIYLYDNSCRRILTHVVVEINSCNGIRSYLHLVKLVPHMLYAQYALIHVVGILTHVAEGTNLYRKIYKLYISLPSLFGHCY